MNGDDIPQSFQKGEAFEQYLRNRIFTKSQYSIVEKTHGFHENNGDYIESTLHPDFKLRDLTNDREFYLEAKFRTNVFDTTINWCHYRQLLRYRDFNKVLPLFIALGIGRTADDPYNVFILPLHEAGHTDLYLSIVNKFKIGLDAPLSSQLLWNRYNPKLRKAG